MFRRNFLTSQLSLWLPILILIAGFCFLPVVYETVDDRTMASILEGEKALHFAPDTHALFIHYFLGYLISVLSMSGLNLPWYGFGIAALYITAYAAICRSLPGTDGNSTVKQRIAILVAFLFAYALLPLLLLQFTIVAGLLALAGMLPVIRFTFQKEACTTAAWVVGLVCVALGTMVRLQMAALVILVCAAPAICLQLFPHRDRYRIFVVLSYLSGIALIGLTLQFSDGHYYNTSPAYARLRKFVRVLDDYSSYPDKHAFDSIADAAIGWSKNDHEMFQESMVLDSGVFKLENAQRLEEVAGDGSGPVSFETGNAHPAGKPEKPPLRMLGKLQRLLEKKDTKDVLRSLYLVIICGAAASLLAASVVVKAWKRAAFIFITACGAGAGALYTIIGLNRPVFRVIFPLSYVFLCLALIVFPWDGIWAYKKFPDRTRLVLQGLLAAFAVLTVMAGCAGIVQGYTNHTQQQLFSRMMKEIRSNLSGSRSVVAWPDALPIQYYSPFERPDHITDANVFPIIGAYSSYPARLNRFKERFGDDVYAGLLHAGTVHLLSSDEQLDRLRKFSVEHYGRTITPIRAAEFNVGNVEITAWVLPD